MQYEVKQGQTIYDVAVLLYGDSQYAVKLAVDNGIDITDNIAGLTLVYNEFLKPKVLKRMAQTNLIVPIVNNTYKVQQGQSIYDLPLQFNYGIDQMALFFQQVGISVDNIDIAGSEISVTILPGNIPTSTIFATLFMDSQSDETGYLLQEDGFYILQENGDKIIL